jgi:hypothetical protein
MSDSKTVFLEDTKFDLENGNDYSVEVTSEGVVVYSECCADTMTRETAKRLYYAIGNYLASTPE